MTRALLGAVVAGALACAACGADDDVFASNTFASGRILIAGPTGPLRGAQVRAEQVDYLAHPPEVRIRELIEDTTTNDDGEWSIDGRQLSGQYRLTFSGGTFTDPATAATVELDAADQLEAFIEVEIATSKSDYLITPISIATAAAARARFATGVDERFGVSLAFAAEHVDRHFGGVRWADLQLADLDQPAATATDGVRGAWVLGAIDTLARDVASSADASPNEVNPYRLAQAWAADLGRVDRPRFDGNDGDAPGGGLRLGAECPAPDQPCMALPGCDTRMCRPACEIYSGTARVAVAGALLSFARSDANRTGIPDSDALAIARAIQNNTDAVLFDPDGCIEELDRVGPMLAFDEPAAGFVRGAVTAHASATDNIDRVPVVSFVDLPDQDGNITDFQATTTVDTTQLAGDTLTIRARAVDDAGNVTEIERSWPVDNLAPVLTVDASGFYVDGPSWWILPPLTTGPTLSGTVTDANGVTVAAYNGPALLATATVTGSSWTLTLPADTVATVAGVDVTIVARDPVGNPATQTIRLRYDDTAPVLALVPTTVRDERGDAIAFADSVPDPSIGNVLSYNPTHGHAPAPAVALGVTPAPACAPATAPHVWKHAYLLDEDEPAYVSETGGAAAGGRNPLAFAFDLTDDGVGLDLEQTAYRVRDVTSGAIVLDWQPLPGGTPILDGAAVIGRSHVVPLYRVGTAAPSIPALAIEGLYEIQLRGADKLGREVVGARCWNHRLLPSPIYVAPPSEMRQARNGPNGSGKYGFANDGGLSLADTPTPMDPTIDPIGAQVLTNDAPVGLVEFPLYNPTTEAVFVALDLTPPSGAAYTKEVYTGYWAKSSQTLTDVDCGLVPGPAPNYSLPGCSRYTGFPGPTVNSTPSTGITPRYAVRVFEEVSPSTMTEIPCSTCAPPMPPAGSPIRVVVMLPPRASGSAPPRRFWIVAVASGLGAALRPEGSVPPYTEHTPFGQYLTGTYDTSQTVCSAFMYQSATASYHCVSRSTYRRYLVTTRATFRVNQVVRTDIHVSRDGHSTLQPSYLVTNDMDDRTTDFAPWNTAEAMLPLPPTAP